MVERAADKKLAIQVKEALRQDPRLASRRISVQVQKGVATLSGTVGRYPDKMAAAEDAWRVAGVAEVRNRLQVRPDRVRDALEIAAEVMDALAADSHINTQGIVVEVAEGLVRLSGAVSSQMERRAAEESAWKADGVVDISNELTVSDQRRRPDHEIEADVREALNTDARISDATGIKVRSIAGTVRLEGAVSDVEEREAAERDAWYTGGVVYVENRLRVTNRGERPAAA